MSAIRKRCFNIMGVDWTEGSKQCELMVDYIEKVSGGVFTFDATQFNYEW